MPRSLAIAAAVVVLAIGVTGFLAGYLGARDEPPPQDSFAAPASVQGGAQAFGTVRSVGADILIETDDGDELRLPAGDTRVLGSESTGLDDIEAGDTVLLALETDRHGGQAIRLVIVTKGAG